MIKSIYFILIFSTICFSSCNTINKEEQIPSYVSVDIAIVQTNYGKEGSNSHSICDSWIYVNQKLIGIFENPTKYIPVLESGRQHIEILPGIKENGSSSYRVDYLMMDKYSIDTILKEGEILKLEPKFQYFSNVHFALLEDFDQEGNYFQKVENSVPMHIISGENLFENRCMYFSMEKDKDVFECRAVNLIPLPTNGSNVYLEVNYKCNGYFTFGFFDRHSSSTEIIETRTKVFNFNPSGNIWRKVYVNLKSHLIDASGIEFRPFFMASKDNNKTQDKVEVYIDNIKILYR